MTMKPELEIIDRIHTELVRREFEIQKDITELYETPAVSLNDATLGQVNKEIKALISLLLNDIKKMKVCVQEIRNEEHKKKLLVKVERHKKEYNSLLSALRKAILQNKSNLKLKREQDRTALLEGGKEALLRRRSQAQKNHFRTAKEITSSLSRSRHMMSSEVDRSAELLTALENSSTTLTDVTKQHHQFSAVLGTGHRILDIMKKRDWTDWLLIMAATALFFLVVLYILKSRMMSAASPFFGILGYVHWLASFLFFWT